MSMRLISVGLCLALSASAASAQRPADTIAASGGEIRIVPLAHATLQIVYGDVVILVDPALDGALPPPPAPPGAPAPPPPPLPLPGTLRTMRYQGLSKPTLIVVTHEHEDHFAPEAIAHVRTAASRIVGPPSLVSRIPGLVGITAGETRTIEGTRIEAVPMYNVTRGPKQGEVFHPKGGGNGYVLTLGGRRILVAGDSECTPELKALSNIDVAFLPMNLPFTMTPADAAACAKAFRPTVVYPYHYAGQDVRDFAAALQGSGVEVRVRNWYPLIRPSPTVQ